MFERSCAALGKLGKHRSWHYWYNSFVAVGDARQFFDSCDKLDQSKRRKSAELQLQRSLFSVPLSPAVNSNF